MNQGFEGWSGPGALATIPRLSATRTVLTATTASVSFFAPVQPFVSIRIVGLVRGDQAAAQANLQMRLNGDSGANYAMAVAYGFSGGAGGTTATAQTSAQIAYMVAATSLANTGTCFVLEIPFFNSTTFFKTWVARDTGVVGTTITGIETDRFGGVWLSTAAITQVTLFPASGNFIAGSTFALYAEA